MGATFTDRNGKPQPLVMGCYGIGVSRVAAAAVEQQSDDLGIRWPVPIAPFEVVVACLSVKDAELVEAAEGLYQQFRDAGVDVMLDDRKMGTGAKMKDLELMGFPYLVYIGRSWKNDDQAEVRDRPAGEKTLIAKDQVFQTILDAVQGQRSGLLPR
jgi:prolyl-tRNA synthetase